MKNLNLNLFKTKTNQTDDDNFIIQNKQNFKRKSTKIDSSIMNEMQNSETLISQIYHLPN